MQPFNEKSKAHRTRVAEIIMSLASKDDGVLWEDLVKSVRAEFTVSNWIRIREVMQFLLNKGLIKRTDNIHEERLVMASIGKSEGWFGRYKNLHSSIAARIEGAPASAQDKFRKFEDPFKGGFDSLIDYEGEFKDLKAFSDLSLIHI